MSREAARGSDEMIKHIIKTALCIGAISAVMCASACRNTDVFTGSEEEATMHSSVSSVQSEEISVVSVLTEEERREIAIDKIDGFDKKFFVKKLDTGLLEAFASIYEGVKTNNPDIKFEFSISSLDLDKLMYLVNYDSPELFALSGSYVPKYTDEEHSRVSGVYMTFIETVTGDKKYKIALDREIEKIKKAVKDKTDYEKEKYVYDYIFNNTVYNEGYITAGSVYGVLVEHKGRCEGLCKTFALLMRELGVECMCVCGTPKWSTDSMFSGHSWNIIKIDGEYYNLDLTLDNLPQDKEGEKAGSMSEMYCFFNVDDKALSETHELDQTFIDFGAPKCTGTAYNYHTKNGLVIKKTDDVKGDFLDLLTEHFDGEVLAPLSVRFENKDNFDELIDNKDDYFQELLTNDEAISYDYSTYYSTLSKVIVSEIKQKN